MKQNSLVGAVLVLMVGGVFTDVVCAQERGQVEVDSKRMAIEPADGIQLGSFLILPDIVVSEMYDSNIFATRDNEVDDTLTILYPDITAKSTWDRARVGAFSRRGVCSVLL